MRKPALDGVGWWENSQIVGRYKRYCRELRHHPKPISTECGSFAERGWACAVLEQIIDGIKHDDPACARIGVELIEEDGGFVFGMSLKAQAARALRRASLDEYLKDRIRRRVLDMLCAEFMPREFRDYAKLARKIGLGDLRSKFEDLIKSKNPWVRWYVDYLTNPNLGLKPLRISSIGSSGSLKKDLFQ